jgi:cyclopropane-fatty-acyl-phospholipid synthase
VTVILPADPTAIDPRRWPDVVDLPDNPMKAAIAAALVRRAVRLLPLRVTTADGQSFGAGTTAEPNLHLIRPSPSWPAIGSPATSPGCSP